MEGYAYFPSVVYRDERPEFVEELLPHAIKHLDGIRNTQGVLCQTGLLQNKSEFRSLSDYLLILSVNVLKDQGYDIDRYDFYVSSIWAQEVGKNSSTDVHVHANSQISGWVFLEVPQGGSYPVYFDPRLHKAMVELSFAPSEIVTNATNTIHFNNIKPGTVLFSNSWMRHQLTNNNSDQPTRCLHFVVSHKERPCNMC